MAVIVINRNCEDAGMPFDEGYCTCDSFSERMDNHETLFLENGDSMVIFCDWLPTKIVMGL